LVWTKVPGNLKYILQHNQNILFFILFKKKKKKRKDQTNLFLVKDVLIKFSIWTFISLVSELIFFLKYFFSFLIRTLLLLLLVNTITFDFCNSFGLKNLKWKMLRSVGRIYWSVFNEEMVK
jgi:hypothetical protein